MRKLFYGVFGAWVILVVTMVLPPIYKAIAHLCPMRGDSIHTAEALPNFARKYSLSCTACHSAWPTLNETGRQFKINGYRKERDESLGMAKEVQGMRLPEMFPLTGAIVKLRPYDKRQTAAEFKHRALHEVEVFLAGTPGKDLSYLTEFEMEDENDNAGGNAFRVDVGALQAGWHPRTWANVMMAYRSFYDMDPFQTVGNQGKVTVADRQLALTKAIGGQSPDGSQQTTMVYGELERQDVGSVYYAAGLTSDKGDGEGAGGKMGNLRVMLDSQRGVALGAFTTFGTVGKVEKANQAAGKVPTTKRYDTRLYGIDALFEFAGLTTRTAFTTQTDKDRFVTTGPGTKSTERAAYVEAMYAFMKDNRPIFVPLIRQGWTTTTNGRDHTAELTLQLASYIKPNAKAFLEYTGETNKTTAAKGAQAKGHRVTAQIEFGF